MDQSIRVESEDGKFLFEFPVWTMKEFWKGSGREAEDFKVPTNETAALMLCIDAGLLNKDDLEEFNPRAKIYIPDEWKPMPEGLELFQRDANGEYVREAPKEDKPRKPKETTKERLRRKLKKRQHEQQQPQDQQKGGGTSSD